jgi:phosphatidyl-myo-inositol dimannoside synthase
MRVLLVSQDFPPAVGGIETYAWELARRLAEAASLTVIAPAAKGSEALDATLDATTHRVRTRPDLLPLALLPRLAQMATRERWSVSLHAQWQTAIPAMVSRRLTGYPRRIVIAAHGRELLFNGLPRPLSAFYDGLRRLTIRKADALLPVSRYTAELLKALGAPADRIHIVNNGTDPDRFRPVDSTALRERLSLGERRVILTVTRLVGRKGVDTVIDALPAVLAEHPASTYLVVGDGPERETLERRTRATVPEADVRFLGRIPHDELPAYYSMADFAVMPSRNEAPDVEGFGLVFLEANACGCAVIGARSGGIPDAILEERTGLLVPPNDPRQLADAMIRLLDDVSLRERLGREGRRRVVEEATWDHSATTILRILRELDAAP